MGFSKEWEPYILFIKWPSTMIRKYSRNRILKALLSHQVSGVRYMAVIKADIILALKRSDLKTHQLAEEVERAIRAEFGERIVVIPKPLKLLRELIFESERILHKKGEASN